MPLVAEFNTVSVRPFVLQRNKLNFCIDQLTLVVWGSIWQLWFLFSLRLFEKNSSAVWLQYWSGKEIVLLNTIT